MSDASTGSERATGDASTPLEERAFGEAGSSFEAHARLRQSATARMRTYRRNKRLGLSRSPKPAVNSVDHPLLDNAAPGSLTAKRGPGGFTPEMQQRILTLVAETNLSLRQMCKQYDDLPGISTLHRWAAENREFGERLHVLMMLRCDDLAWECLAIADAGEGDHTVDDDGQPIVNREHLMRTELRLKERHWLIEQLRPERYGDKRVVSPVAQKPSELPEAPVLRIEDHPQYAVLQAYRAGSETK